MVFELVVTTSLGSLFIALTRRLFYFLFHLFQLRRWLRARAASANSFLGLRGGLVLLLETAKVFLGLLRGLLGSCKDLIKSLVLRLDLSG